MAITTINLSDPVSTLVTKTNTISSTVGDKTLFNTSISSGGQDSNLVAAINFVNNNSTDSSVITALIDSSYVLARSPAPTTSVIRAMFQKDSANAIGFDSSAGRFFVPIGTINTDMIENVAVTTGKIANTAVDTAQIADNAITEAKMADDAISSAELKTLSTLLIKDSAGSTLKTIHGAGV